IFFTDQPNSGETISQLSIDTSLHSLRALMPFIRTPWISIWSEYQRAARHSSVISELRTVRIWSCQSGYHRLKKQFSASILLHSFNALSPSAGPSNRQFLTITSSLPYSAL